MKETFENTTTPIDFVERKAKEEGFDSLSSLEKAYWCFGKSIDMDIKASKVKK